jgi:hypothetical protein
VFYYPGYPNPPLIQPSLIYKFKYTPILIEFVPGVIIEGDTPDTDNRYMKITTPTSLLPGAKQSLKDEKIIPIPSTGILKFKLLPSKIYSPIGQYKVGLYKKGSSLPVDEMIWTVPYAPNPISVTLQHNPGGDYLGSTPIYEILKINRTGEYHIENNTIIWDSNPPTVGETYNVELQPGVSLDRLVSIREVK